jgi:hypothetical protein
MLQTRKLIRDAIKAALSDATSGFNARFSSVATAYGITAVALNWSAGSNTFVQMALPPEAEDLSQLIGAPLAIALYTSISASSSQDPNRTKFSPFSGAILAHCDFYFTKTTGLEIDDTESFLDAVEDAFIQVIQGATWPSVVAYNGDISCAREPLVLIEDGYRQRIPFTLTLEVDL